MILGGLRGAGGGTDASVSNRGFCRIRQYSPFATTLDILEVYHHFQKKGSTACASMTSKVCCFGESR